MGDSVFQRLHDRVFQRVQRLANGHQGALLGFAGDEDELLMLLDQFADDARGLHHQFDEAAAGEQFQRRGAAVSHAPDRVRATQQNGALGIGHQGALKQFREGVVTVRVIDRGTSAAPLQQFQHLLEPGRGCSNAGRGGRAAGARCRGPPRRTRG